MNLLSLTYAATAGICCYAGLTHLILGLRTRDQTSTHLSFSAMAFAFAGHNIGFWFLEHAAYQGEIALFQEVNKWTSGFMYLSMGCAFLFMGLFANIQWKTLSRLLFTIYSFMSLLIFINLFLWTYPQAAVALDRPLFTGPPWHKFEGPVTVFCLLFFYIYCITNLVQNDEKKKVSIFIVAGFFYIFATTWDSILIYTRLLSFDYLLSHFGILVFTLAISLHLSGNIANTQQKLRQSEAELKKLFDLDLIGITTTSPGKTWIDINSKLCSLFGYSEEELRQKSWTELTHPEDLQKNIELFEQLQRGEIDQYCMEKRYIRKDGSILHAQLLIHSMLDEAGKLEKVVAMVQDIGEQKKAQQELEQTRALLIAALEASPAGILIVDAVNQGIRYLNRSGVKLCKEASKESGIPFNDRYIEWDIRKADGTPYPPEELLLARATFKGETVHNEESIIVLEDGTQRTVLVTAAPVRNAEDEIIAGLVVFPDITDLKEAQSEKEKLQHQLLHAQKMEALGLLTGGIAHDYNNMLGVIVAYTELAMEELTEDSPIRVDLKQILKAANRSRSLTAKLLTFSRQDKPSIKPVMISKLMNEVKDILDRSLQKKVSIKRSIESDLEVILDENQIHQALVNLCMNACDAMPQGGVLRLEARAVKEKEQICSQCNLPIEGHYCEILVIDTGHGIPPETLSSIFDPFFTTKEAGKGTGLGLSTTLGIIQGHGGHVHIDSQPGQGTTVKLLLPMRNPPKVSPPTPIQNKAFSGGNEVILVVDDEPAMTHMAERSLAKIGYKVLKANSGQEALDLYQREPNEIDLVLLDMIMPEMGGAEVLETIRKKDPKAKIVITSGYSEQAPKMVDNNTAFIQKPYQLKQLIQIIRNTLDG